MRKLDFDAEFHAIYNWGGSFGYFSDAENLEVVRRFARALRRGGRVLIDQPNREYILRHFRPRTVRGNLRTRTKWQPPTERVETIWKIARGVDRRESVSSIRLYTPGQFRRLFSAAGLHVEKLFGGIGSQYRPGSRRIFVVARKT